MKPFERLFYPIYGKFQGCSWWVTIIHFFYNRVLPLRKRETRLYRYRPERLSFYPANYAECKNMREIKIAFVCDEMTFRDFETECRAEYVNPSNWFQVFESFRPDLFFCESTWHGIDSTWRGRVYKNKKVKFENRRELLNIIDYCQKNSIKTVFWNKEDPVYFNDQHYNFVDTALKFDYIFTTSQECIPLYRRLGHQNVEILMFGFSPKLFNPMNSGQGKGAVFAGSWYANQTDRCQDTEECFEMIIKKGIPLTIYDRHSRSANPNNRFPEKYTSLINNCIEFSKLGDVLKQFRYAININTIKDSQTMFARRVFELMACNTVVISNESIGLRQLFNSNVWFVNDDFDRNSLSRICNENLIEVFKNHTCNQRLRYLLKNVQINFCEDNGNVVILYDGTANDTDECRLHYRGLPYEQKCGFIHEDYAFRKLSDDSILTKQQFLSESSFFGYFIMADSTSPSNMDIDYALKHFEYIEEATGIREGEHIYCYINDSYNLNTLFEIGILESLLENKNRMLKKYLI